MLELGRKEVDGLDFPMFSEHFNVFADPVGLGENNTQSREEV